MKTKTILTLCMALCTISPAIVAQNKNNGSRFLDNIYKSSQNQRNNNSSSQLEQMFKDAYKRVEKKKKLESEKQKQIEREQSFKKEVENSDDSFLDADPGQDKSAESNKKDITAQKNAVAKKEKDDISLVVSGEGSNKTEATKNALRSAIEQAYGTFVSASTEILNDELVRDEIATVASGNIKSYKELSSMALPNGNSSVTLSAIVSIGNLVQYAQSHGSSAEFAGQTFMMNMRMRELNRKNELIVFEHIIRELEQIRFSLYDYNLDVQEPKLRNAYVYTNKDNPGPYDGRYVVKETVKGYEIPMTLSISSNKNYDLFVKNTISKLKSISLAEEEVSDYKNNNYPVGVLSLFGQAFNLRNAERIRGAKLNFAGYSTLEEDYLSCFLEIVQFLLLDGMCNNMKIVAHTRGNDIACYWYQYLNENTNFNVGTNGTHYYLPKSPYDYRPGETFDFKNVTDLFLANNGALSFAIYTEQYELHKWYYKGHSYEDRKYKRIFSARLAETIKYEDSILRKMIFALFYRNEDIQDVLGFEVQPIRK